MAKEYLSANPPYVVVEKGDTLSEIAQKYSSYIDGTGLYGTGGKIATLTKINDITDANRIVIGQKIQLSGSSIVKKNNTSTPTIKAFGLQSNTNRTVYAAWTWSKTNTENYKILWQYDTGNDVWFTGENSTTTDKQSLYNAPSNANKVRFKVKPVSKKRKVNGKETSYWTASWSNIKTYEFKNNPPMIPTLPNDAVTIDENDKITIELDNLDTSVKGLNASTLQFQIYRNSTKLVHTGKGTISDLGHISYSWMATPGYKYSVRCRSVRDSLYSDWTDLTEGISSRSRAPSRIIECSSSVAGSTTYITVKWTEVSSAEQYEAQCMKVPNNYDELIIQNGETYFDIAETTDPDLIKSIKVDGDTNYTRFNIGAEVEASGKYSVRVRAFSVKDDETTASEWSPIETIIVGTAPSEPTTWSSTNRVLVGDPLTLYWIHNSKDNSSPSEAYVYFSVTIPDNENPGQTITHTYRHTIYYDDSSSVEEEQNGIGEWIETGLNIVVGLFGGNSIFDPNNDDDEIPVSRYEIQTSNFAEGAKIKWSVATRGVGSVFGPTSIVREFDIYDAPTIDTSFTGNVGIADDDDLDFVCYALPVSADIDVYSSLQTPIGYQLSIIANDRHESVDEVGNRKIVNTGEIVYSKYLDTTDNPLHVELSAGDLDLENNVLYTFRCNVAMDSGLGLEQSSKFRVLWTDEQYEPNAEISIDPDSVSASIRPYCEDDEGNLIENVLLSVYRHEFDGTFVELIKDVENTSATFVTDPHPALDYARYRIVAKDNRTGGISYYDIPGYPVNEKAAILQWDEDWNDFNGLSADIENEIDGGVWSGSMLKLLYNIDVQDSNERDVELVEYIGRRHPVSYYGTQVGHMATWSMEVPKTDTDTLHMLRKLASWMGDVYVREPSGSGYWASVSVSFKQTHRELTIPVTLDIKRVEGGI